LKGGQAKPPRLGDELRAFRSLVVVALECDGPSLGLFAFGGACYKFIAECRRRVSSQREAEFFTGGVR
jgi:hypothetical protein